MRLVKSKTKRKISTMQKYSQTRVSDIDMRDAFFDELFNIAKNDSQVIFLTADMGAHSLARFKKELPNQYFNVGVAEQNMVSIAAGLALGGKKVFIYTIIPFMTLRCYEQIKIDLCCMNLPVTIIGVGPGFCYGSDGPTHHATQDIAAMRALPEMTILNPSDPVMSKVAARIAYKNSSPTYVRIDKGKLPIIYHEKKNNFSDGLTKIISGDDLLIISTGVMIHQSIKITEILSNSSISAGAIDLYRIKPLNVELLLKLINKTKHIVTLEENAITGGIGSAVSEVLSDSKSTIPLKRIAIPDEHCFKSGNRESLHATYNLDAKSVAKIILEWLS